MSDISYPKIKIQKKLKFSDSKMADLLHDTIEEDRETYTEKEWHTLKQHIRAYPYGPDDLCRRFKIDRSMLNLLAEKSLIPRRNFLAESELEVLYSFLKLKRLGYTEEACLRVLTEVGVPRDDDPSQDSSYIQLKELADQTSLTERTIKYYEKTGLTETPRIYKNKRYYPLKAVVQLELIRDLQHLGYKLVEIGEILKKLQSENPEEKESAGNTLQNELEERKNLIKEIIRKVQEI